MTEKQFIKEHIQEFIEFRDKNYVKHQNGEYSRATKDEYAIVYFTFNESELIDEFLKTIQ